MGQGSKVLVVMLILLIHQSTDHKISVGTNGQIGAGNCSASCTMPLGSMIMEHPIKSAFHSSHAYADPSIRCIQQPASHNDNCNLFLDVDGNCMCSDHDNV